MPRPLPSPASLARLGALSCCAVLGALGCASSSDRSTPPTDDGVSQIVYAVRQHTVIQDGSVQSIDVAGGMGQVMDYGRYVPGGKLMLHDLKLDRSDNIIADYPTADVSSVDVSFDATKVLFTMKRDENDHYHVYIAPLAQNAAGKFEITQLTNGPYDDQQAVFAPGDRVVFTTNQGYTEMGTRADEYNHSRVVTQLATMTIAGGDADRKLCSQNLSHIVTLFPLHDGRVGFARWEHLENVNDVKLFAMNPDCTQMIALSGQHGKPGNSVVQATESLTPNVFYSIVTNRENTIQAGALVRIDARSEGDASIFDEERSSQEAYEVLTPNVPLGDEESAEGRYRAPAVLPNGNLLLSWANGPVNEISELIATPPDYGIYVFDVKRNRRELIVNDENVWELYAKPVMVRQEPQDLASRQAVVDAATPAVFGSIDVRNTSLTSRHGETVSGAQFDSVTMDEALAHAVKVRVIEGFSSEAANQTMFGLTMAEGAALLGEAKVEADGSWLAQVPPYVPMHLQPVDDFDLAIRSQTTWIQAMPGEGRVCGGCHESRTGVNSPGAFGGQQPGQMNSLASTRGPENFMIPVRERVEYPWDKADDAGNVNEIQALLTAKCASCHNETTNGNGPQQTYSVTMTNKGTGQMTTYQIPRLDLTDRQITVTYDRKTQAWPASYVSLFYPAAIEMEMGRGAMVTGTVPPKWAVPSDARHSALVEKLNITSVKDDKRYAWPLGQAFTDPGIAGGTRTDHAAAAGLTREETVKLIRAIDMGGQYYSRQNTQFAPATIDPVAGKGASL